MFENQNIVTRPIINETICGCLRIYAPLGDEGTVFLFCPVYGENTDQLVAMSDFVEFRYKRSDGWNVSDDMLAGLDSFAEDGVGNTWFDMQPAQAFKLTRVDDEYGTTYVAEAEDQWALVFRNVGVYTKHY